MRDGVKLAATVRLPPGKTLADGPFPTVIEESGYAIAAPHSLIDAELHQNGETTSDPLVPDTATAVGSLIAPLLGFATVSLQMRGTGCSGGAFDLFDLPTTYDGYDAVQIVAAQPWVANHKVGMVGISFSGISQMFVAGDPPPGLAAIAPMSLTDDLYNTGFPGGMFNSGLRRHLARPAGGRRQARRHKAARPTPRCSSRKGTPSASRTRRCTDRPRTSTPCSQRPATGCLPSTRSGPPPPGRRRRGCRSSFPAPSRTSRPGVSGPPSSATSRADPHVWVTIVNGTHTDSLGPGTITRWLEFLDIFVADKVPTASPVLTALAPEFYSGLADAPSGAAAGDPVHRTSRTWRPPGPHSKNSRE